MLMSVSFETLKLWAERYLGTATPDDYVDWAVTCLESDLDSKNIRILASLRNASSSSEVEDYFYRSLNDLGWAMPDERECLFAYARGLAQQIVSGDVQPLDGCQRIYRIASTLQFPPELRAWLCLDEGLQPDHLGDLQGAALDEAIKSEAARLLSDKRKVDSGEDEQQRSGNGPWEGTA
jgi:hypothetical protein